MVSVATMAKLTTKQKAGRKPPARGPFLHVEVDEGDLERWRAAAAGERLLLSAWVRRVLDAAAERAEKKG